MTAVIGFHVAAVEPHQAAAAVRKRKEADEAVLAHGAVQAQTVGVYASVDSIRVGEPFEITLVARHGILREAVFPDGQSRQQTALRNTAAMSTSQQGAVAVVDVGIVGQRGGIGEQRLRRIATQQRDQHRRGGDRVVALAEHGGGDRQVLADHCAGRERPARHDGGDIGDAEAEVSAASHRRPRY